MNERTAREPPTKKELQAMLDRSPFINFCNMRVIEVDAERERIVVAMPMLLDNNHFVVMAVSVPATIMIPIAGLDDDYALLGLRH